MSETKIGKYTILGEVGRGAMGIVYKATDPYIGRTVAVKTIRFDTLGQGPERDMAQKRFMREAHSAGNLSHPNIVTIYDVGEDGDLSYIAMEYIDGCSLEELISSRKKLSLEETVSLVEQVANALDTAHRKGVVHRDIKPANILIDQEGKPHLVDFGIARLATSTMTQTNMIMGTPYYMSPEQIAGKKVDNRSDIFALGGVLYEMLTGQKPFPGESITTVIYKIMNENPLPVRNFQKNLPEGLEPILQKALAKDPAARYQSCREMVNDIKKNINLAPAATLVREPVPVAVPVPAAAPAKRPVSGRPLFFVLGGILGVAVIIVVVLLLTGKSGPPVNQGGGPAGPLGPVPPVVQTDRFVAAQTLWREGKREEARAVFALIPDSDLKYFEAQFCVAEILREENRLPEAAAEYQRLTTLKADDPRPYLRLAQIADQQNEAENALAYYKKYLTLSPAGPEALAARSRAASLEKAAASSQVPAKPEPQTKVPSEKKEAEIQVKPEPKKLESVKPEPAKTEPSNPEPVKPEVKAETKVEKKPEPAEKKEQKKPPVTSPELQADIRKMIEAGVWSLNRRDYDQAVKKLEDVLALDPGNEDAQRFLALAKQKQLEDKAQKELGAARDAMWYRKYDEALRSARNALRLDAKNEEAKKLIAAALQGLQKTGPDEVAVLIKQYAAAVPQGGLAAFFQKSCTAELFQKIKRDTELIVSQYSELRISTSGVTAKVTDFQADQTQGVIRKMSAEATFGQMLTGIPPDGSGRKILFEGKILWRLEKRGEEWKITEIISTPKGK
jgi:tRNA A-37 threonylcarbamoyl transferase component Bud32/tetratricopeptide (TPR) repeat protein